MARPGPLTAADITFVRRAEQNGSLLNAFKYQVGLHGEPLGVVLVEMAVVGGESDPAEVIARRLNDYAAEHGREALFDEIASDSMQLLYQDED